MGMAPPRRPPDRVANLAWELAVEWAGNHDHNADMGELIDWWVVGSREDETMGEWFARAKAEATDRQARQRNIDQWYIS